MGVLTKRGMSLHAVLLAGTCLAAPAAMGQEATQAGSAGQVADIVVTATRREERLQDVPVAVTALSADNLEQQQITSVDALQRAAPNLTIGAISGDPTQAVISIRGPTNLDSTISLDPAAGLYLDGVYIARASGANLRMIDVARVEVLRGPQGTLFGRNTIGGAINVVPQRPEGAFGGSLEVGIGNFESREITGILNVPFDGDRAGLRLVAHHSERDGYAQSSLTNDELDADDTDYFRAIASFELNPNWSVLLSADYTQTENTGQWINLLQSTPLFDTFVAIASGFTLPDASSFVGYTDRPALNAGGFEGETWGVGATITGELGGATIKSITALRNTARETVADADATPFTALQTVLADSDVEQFSQEVQLYGQSFDDRLDWIIGAYYFSESGEDNTRYRALYPIFTQTTTSNLGEGENTSWAFYAQGVFSLTERLRFTAGARYVEDERELVLNSTVVNDFTNAVTCGVSAASLPDCTFNAPSASFDYVPFTLGLDYRFSDEVLGYLKYSRGFRSGGLNIRGTTAAAINAFGPEDLDSWEAGLKGDYFNRRLRLNANVYYQEYNDIQIAYTAVVPPDPTPTNIIENSGDTRTYGIEIEGVAVLGDFTFTLGLGTADAEFTRSANAGVTSVSLDQPVPYTPEWTGSFGVDYRRSTSFGAVRLHADYMYRDDVYMSLAEFVPATSYLGPPPSPPVPFATFIPSYGLFNAIATLEFENLGLEVSVWGRNLGDEEYYNFVGDFAFAAYGNPGAPRTYGVTAKLNF